MHAKIKRVVDSMAMLTILYTDNEKSDYLKFIARYYSLNKRKNLIDDIKSEPDITITPQELNRDKDILPVRNGYINLKTGEIQPHSKDALCTHCLDVEYNPTSPYPNWHAFLSQVQTDSDIQAYLQRYAGMCATGHSGQIVAFFVGQPGTGKTTFTDVLFRLLNGYTGEINAESLLLSRGSSKYDIASVEHRRLVVAREMRAGYLSLSVFKSLADTGVLHVERKYEQPYDIERTHSLIIYANDKPTIRDPNDGAWRRLHTVTWDNKIENPIWDYANVLVHIPGNYPTLTLPVCMAQLLLIMTGFFQEAVLVEQEAEGILAWIVAGAKEWHQNGQDLQAPEVIIKATQDWQREEDTVGQWMDACCTKGDGCLVSVEDALASYKEYIEEPISDRQFYRQMTAKGYKGTPRPYHGKNNKRCYIGIGLVSLPDTENQENQDSHDRKRSLDRKNTANPKVFENEKIHGDFSEISDHSDLAITSDHEAALTILSLLCHSYPPRVLRSIRDTRSSCRMRRMRRFSFV